MSFVSFRLMRKGNANPAARLIDRFSFSKFHGWGGIRISRGVNLTNKHWMNLRRAFASVG